MKHFLDLEFRMGDEKNMGYHLTQGLSQRPVHPFFGRAISKVDGGKFGKPVQKTGTFIIKEKKDH